MSNAIVILINFCVSRINKWHYYGVLYTPIKPKICNIIYASINFLGVSNNISIYYFFMYKLYNEIVLFIHIHIINLLCLLYETLYCLEFI